jgi:hypothetical protein
VAKSEQFAQNKLNIPGAVHPPSPGQLAKQNERDDHHRRRQGESAEQTNAAFVTRNRLQELKAWHVRQAQERLQLAAWGSAR